MARFKCQNGHDALADDQFCGTCAAPVAVIVEPVEQETEPIIVPTAPIAAIGYVENPVPTQEFYLNPPASPLAKVNTNLVADAKNSKGVRNALVGAGAALALVGGGLFVYRAMSSSDSSLPITGATTSTAVDPIVSTPITTDLPSETVPKSSAPTTTQDVVTSSIPAPTTTHTAASTSVPAPTTSTITETAPAPTETVTVEVVTTTPSPTSTVTVLVSTETPQPEVTVTETINNRPVLSDGCEWWFVFSPDGLVNIRESTSTSAPVLAQIPPKSTVVMERCELTGWVQVSYEGTDGWVRNDLDWTYWNPYGE